jgi:hypothetical protein
MRIVLVLASVLAASGIARADRVRHPSIECPVGAQVRVDHLGERCVAASCDSDEACGPGRRCSPRTLCVRSLDLPPFEHQGVPARTEEIVVGACARPGSCQGSSSLFEGGELSGNARCREQRVCIPGDAPADVRDDPPDDAADEVTTTRSPAVTNESPPATTATDDNDDDDGCGASGRVTLVPLIGALGLLAFRRRPPRRRPPRRRPHRRRR